jgi:tetratricopeptide (TPR) repeat protein
MLPFAEQEIGSMTKPDEINELKEALDELIKKATKLTKAGQHDDAAEMLEQALELDADNVRALDLLGYVRWCLGDYKGSEEVNRRSLEIRPLGAYARKGLGIVLAEQGQVDAGISELHHAMALKPLWVDPIHDLCMVLLKAERYEQAVPMLERCLEMEPKLEKKLRPMLESARKKAAAVSVRTDPASAS